MIQDINQLILGDKLKEDVITIIALGDDGLESIEVIRLKVNGKVEMV